MTKFLYKKFLAIRILLTLLFFKLFTKVLPFRKLLNYLQNIKTKKISRLDFIDKDFVKILERNAKRFGINQCLIKGSTLFFFLKRFNFDPSLHIGINLDNDFKSHCWVETKDLKIHFGSNLSYKSLITIK